MNVWRFWVLCSHLVTGHFWQCWHWRQFVTCLTDQWEATSGCHWPMSRAPEHKIRLRAALLSLTLIRGNHQQTLSQREATDAFYTAFWPEKVQWLTQVKEIVRTRREDGLQDGEEQWPGQSAQAEGGHAVLSLHRQHCDAPSGPRQLLRLHLDQVWRCQSILKKSILMNVFSLRFDLDFWEWVLEINWYTYWNAMWVILLFPWTQWSVIMTQVRGDGRHGAPQPQQPPLRLRGLLWEQSSAHWLTGP